MIFTPKSQPVPLHALTRTSLLCLLLFLCLCSDFYSEFQQALSQSPLFPTKTKMVVLCNRPSYEFAAFQVRE